MAFEERWLKSISPCTTITVSFSDSNLVFPRKPKEFFSLAFFFRNFPEGFHGISFACCLFYQRWSEGISPMLTTGNSFLSVLLEKSVYFIRHSFRTADSTILEIFFK